MNHNKNSKAKSYVSTRENVYSDRSGKKGVGGLAERILRKFRVGAFLFALAPVYLVGVLAMGLSATPGMMLFHYVYTATAGWLEVLHFAAIGVAFFAGFMLYGFSIIFIVPLFNWLMPFRIKPFRGSYFSLESVPWYVHNALTYIVRYTFLEFITPTPLNILFYRMMGMKIGKGSHINTTNISDPALIEIGERVTIGGSVHIFAHYGQKGYLVLSRVKIGDGVNVGIKATIMGDAEIGSGAMIAPHEVILPKSRIPAKRKMKKAREAEDEISGERAVV